MYFGWFPISPWCFRFDPTSTKLGKWTKLRVLLLLLLQYSLFFVCRLFYSAFLAPFFRAIRINPIRVLHMTATKTGNLCDHQKYGPRDLYYNRRRCWFCDYLPVKNRERQGQAVLGYSRRGEDTRDRKQFALLT